jgi:hypothetical protein
MLNVIDEFTHECLAIRVDVIDVLSDLFILRGVPGTSAPTTARSSSPSRKAGHAFRLFQSARGRPCKVNPKHTGILTCLATKRPQGALSVGRVCAHVVGTTAMHASTLIANRPDRRA